MPIGGEQRLVRLPAVPQSARQARRFVADVVTAVGADDFLDTAVLLTSELVTNGIVHAHTDLQLVVEASRRWIRVEVVDGNPMLPARRGYDDDALTGRGLEMVELLADEFGMQALEDEGKRVWFRLGASPLEVQAEQSTAATPADTVAVHLINLPLTLYSAWQEHADAILREAMIVALERDELPEEFSLASQALSALGAQTIELFAARSDGAPTHLDVAIDVPVAVVAYYPVLRDVLRQCSEMSARGELLVPPSLPEIQAVRRWVCDEIGRQGQGVPPRPWTDAPVDDVPLDPTSADAIDAVRRSTLAQVAADRWNRIVAVSPSAAQLLGWQAVDLEGKRLVSIIPPELRHAHVAAFTRQMLGGPSRILGRPTDVPALHHDGSRVPITLLIDRHNDSQGRTLFVATLTAR